MIHDDGCKWVVGPDYRCTCGLWAPSKSAVSSEPPTANDVTIGPDS